MAAPSSPSDKTADFLENLSLESQPNTAENETAKEGIYPDNGTVIYHDGYGYTALGAYPSSNSPVPPMGQDGQLYGTQQYEYPNPFYQPPPSATALYSSSQAINSQGEVPTDAARMSGETTTGNAKYAVNTLNKHSGPKPFRPNNQHSLNLNASQRRGNCPTGFPSSGYQDPRFAYEGFQSPFPWLNATGSGFSSPLNSFPSRPASALGQASGFMNYVYPNNRMYGHYGNRAGSFGYNSWSSGRGWVLVDNKYKSSCRCYGNENIDGLSELNRGPRGKGSKNQKEFGPVAETVVGQNVLLADNNKEVNPSQIIEKEQYTGEDFVVDYLDAKFFVIKSYSEDDVHKSIKYNVWSSTPNGNRKLDAAYREVKAESGGYPIFLVFSVLDAKPAVGLTGDIDKIATTKTQNVRESSDESLVRESVGLAVAGLVKVKVVEENVSSSAPENYVNDSKLVVSSENDVISNVVASAC
ncbi:hypothetical protein K2173_026907 [Erythroxylum novogranatense]|uniref:YTH domain-containing family protein n=1 Tax=Erythroxylum novogranatense TaxID=1862640 RepID=A0AAV8TXM5_9ROSI|nr:hypothetical protein K2173_026907 [Erythroxylum novogranatense]